MFCTPSSCQKLITAVQRCVCLHSIFIAVGVSLVLWHWGKAVDWVWEECWSVCRLLWLKVIGNWRQPVMYSFINCSCHQTLLELRKKRWMAGSCRVHVTRGMRIGLSEILNHNERLTSLLGAYMYTKLQTRWHIHCCQRWLNSLSQTLLHSHYSNTVNISTVFMLVFWLCQFNTGSLAWGCVCHHRLSFLVLFL